MPFFKRRETEGEPSASELPLPPGLGAAMEEQERTRASRDGTDSEPLPLELDIVQDLSLEFLQKIVSERLLPGGKFVRVEDVLLVSPLRVEWNGKDYEMMHRNMLRAALQGPNEELRNHLLGAQAVKASSAERLLTTSGIKDAGRFIIDFEEDGTVTGLKLEGSSSDLGEAGKAGRLDTINLAQQKLGDSVKVGGQ